MQYFILKNYVWRWFLSLRWLMDVLILWIVWRKRKWLGWIQYGIGRTRLKRARHRLWHCDKSTGLVQGTTKCTTWHTFLYLINVVVLTRWNSILFPHLNKSRLNCHLPQLLLLKSHRFFFLKSSPLFGSNRNTCEFAPIIDWRTVRFLSLTTILANDSGLLPESAKFIYG